MVGIKHTLYRCGSNYTLSKLVVDNELEDLWRSKNRDSSEFTFYDRSSNTRSRIDRVYTNIKIDNNAKINYIMVAFINHYSALPLDRFKFPSKSKNGKNGTLILLF